MRTPPPRTTVPTPAADTDRAAAHARRLSRLAGLYAITPDLDDTPRLVALCAAAIEGGAAAIQVRNKSATPALRREQARAIAALCRARGALAIVNDDPALAVDVDADGVHVGADDGGVARARAIVGPERLVGASCYDDAANARAAIAEGADHVAFGSFHPSPTKPHARRASLDLVPRARALGVPIVAIGGIDEHNAGELARAGVDAVAVIQAVFGSGDERAVALAARRLAEAYAAGAALARR